MSTSPRAVTGKQKKVFVFNQRQIKTEIKKKYFSLSETYYKMTVNDKIVKIKIR